MDNTIHNREHQPNSRRDDENKVHFLTPPIVNAGARRSETNMIICEQDF